MDDPTFEPSPYCLSPDEALIRWRRVKALVMEEAPIPDVDLALREGLEGVATGKVSIPGKALVFYRMREPVLMMNLYAAALRLPTRRGRIIARVVSTTIGTVAAVGLMFVALKVLKRLLTLV